MIFRYMKCLEDKKLQFAVFTLTDNAEIWCQSAERTFDTSTGPIIWEGFKERFYEKYFSTDLRYNKQREFMDLRQGVMTVEEYSQEFDKLSRFAPKMVATEVERAKRFVHGLKDGVRGLVQAFNPSTLAEALPLAACIDSPAGAEHYRSLGLSNPIAHKRKAPEPSQRSHVYSRPNQQVRQQNHGVGTWRERPFCKICGKR